MNDDERGCFVAEYVKYIMMSIDLLLVDEENLPFIENIIGETKDILSMGRAFPLFDCSKLDKLEAESEILRKIAELCRVRQAYRSEIQRGKNTLDDNVMRMLGL